VLIFSQEWLLIPVLFYTITALVRFIIRFMICPCKWCTVRPCFSTGWKQLEQVLNSYDSQPETGSKYIIQINVSDLNDVAAIKCQTSVYLREKEGSSTCKEQHGVIQIRNIQWLHCKMIMILRVDCKNITVENC